MSEEMFVAKDQLDVFDFNVAVREIERRDRGFGVNVIS